MIIVIIVDMEVKWIVRIMKGGEVFMTEKRFRLDTGCIIDQEENCVLSDKQVRNLLNEQNDTITRLKGNIDELLSVNVEERLLKENEQLKERVKDWHQRTFKAHEYFNILEEVIDEVCNDDISNEIWKEYEKREKLIE